MTIANVHVTPQRALIAMDTLVSAEEGAFEASKLFPLPLANAVLCAIGDATVVRIAFSLATDRADSGGFDDMVPRMPSLLEQAMTHAIKHHEELHAGFDKNDLRRQLVILVGWSPAHQKVRGFGWSHEDWTAGWQRMEFDEDQVLIHPDHPRIAPLAEAFACDGGSIEDVIALMRAQAQLEPGDFALADVSALRPGARFCGGQAIVAEIRREGVTIHAPVGLGIRIAACAGSPPPFVVG